MIRNFKLELDGERGLKMSRSFNAPRELVFDAWTKPELLQQWMLGPDGWTMPECKIDLRVGGRYRFVWLKEATGERMAMGGQYREIAAPEKLVCTEKFEGQWCPNESLNTLTLEEADGVTLCTQRSEFVSAAVRDSAMRSGMEQGVKASYDRLANVLQGIAR